jgi:rod shape-determining protein MreC
VALLLLTAITLLVFDLPGTGPLDPIRNLLSSAFRPVRAAGDAVFEPIGNGWKGAFGYDDVSEENAQLKAELEERKGEIDELEALRTEVAELKKLNRIRTGDEPSKAAEVISGPLSSFDQSVTIDVGSGDDVQVGMAVVTGGGVLGRIAEVESATATVELLTDPAVSIGVRLRNGDIGSVQGQGQGEPLLLSGVEDDTEVEEGDLITTSGIDRSAFPSDVVVGRVSKVSARGDGVGRDIEVEPSADLTSRYVKVVLREPPP